MTVLVGLLADTHDHLPMVRAAVRVLNHEGVELVLHAGDFIAPFVIPELMKLRAQFVGVFGNNDGDRELLKKKASERDRFEIRGGFASISLNGIQIALLHGHEQDLLKSLQQGGAFDLVVYGHTHRIDTTQHGKTMVVNPGEVCGYLTGTSTVAIFDTSTTEIDIVEL
ncbi:MAG: metallophosphoesterase [Methanomicrobiales archaeon]|nr:metallophosphoesterase [Methanomicrobiales archaeon]